ncbi:Transmembrane protein 33 [Lamellibrachia satsuma]|nr:Transmembrane protein 33 [Lamellibrachia satsuma]
MADVGSGDAGRESSPDSSSSSGATSSGGSALNRVIDHMKEDKLAAVLWLTRLFTVVSSFLFMMPLLGGNPYSYYQKALLSNAATSALRLHQRLPNFQLSREFMALLLQEDSAHYLIFSLIFLTSHPVTMVVIPIFMFALLHATTYTKQLLNKIGPDSLMIVRRMIGKLDHHQANVLRFIAYNEIFLMPAMILMIFGLVQFHCLQQDLLMPAMILMIFGGRGSFLMPFIYYRFLTLRYTSRRNPYCRYVFYELRMTAQTMVDKPMCPQILRNTCYKLIGFICRLAPANPSP